MRDRRYSNTALAASFRKSLPKRMRRPKRKDGEGTVKSNGYIQIQVNDRLTYEHIYLAERALGKRLSRGMRVHHMNENKQDNYTPFNLVICPNEFYHRLLHKRMKER